MEVNLPAEAQKQQQNIKNGNPTIDLFAPCRIGEGILKFSDTERLHYARMAMKNKQSISFFIPASGSGSRMFQFLYAFLENPNEENTAMVEYFFSSMEHFAFYTLLPLELRQQISSGNYDTKDVVLYILNGQGMQLASKPKGLVPFHSMGNFVVNPFQEQILQGEHIHFTMEQIHFTIQKEFETEIQESIDNLRKFTGPGSNIGFSYQESNTDAYAFNSDGTPTLNEYLELVRRPAGHGALLTNLNKIKEDIILIKNIDNIQHWDHHHLSEQYWQLLLGLLQEAQLAIRSFQSSFDRAQFDLFNQTYQLFHSSELANWSDAELMHQLNNPLRVCGMVRNVGQPGGGPYWVREGERLSKQIVEKAQISNMQQSLMIKSTHFNPVMMALCTVDAEGNKLDLNQFVDPEKYFVVEKEYKGTPIRFCELPGLWNGSMSRWNTLFVEVPNEIFSPVKTVLDLLQPIHQPKQ